MQISDSPMYITNIVTDPANKGLFFLVYGVPDGQTYGFVVPVNFEKLMQRTCTHYSDVQTPEISDYEEWVPHSPNQTCINGEQLAYLRRKPDAECHNPDDMEMYRQVKVCACSAEDWECDKGYTREKEHGKCVPVGIKHHQSAPEKCDGYYRIKTGYRKIAGNVCEGGLDLSAHQMVCPGPHRKGMIYLSLFVLVLVVVLLKKRSAFNEEKLRR